MHKQGNYIPSGNISLIGTILSYLICLALALLLSYLYTFLIIIIPIPYLNFLITAGFGICLGMANKTLVRLTHNRNRRSQLVMALCSGLFANYFQWGAYVLYAVTGEIPNFAEYLTTSTWIFFPQPYFEVIGEINRVGMWSIFGVPFNSFALTIIWIIEFLLITGIPIYNIHKANIFPYSELLKKWYPKLTLNNDFEPIATVNLLTQNLHVDPLKSIQELGYGTASRYSKIHVYFLKDEEIQYLTFEKIFIERKGNKNSDTLIENFIVDTNTAKSILDSFSHKRERLEVI